MDQQAITLVINGNTHRLSVNDLDSIRRLPESDRSQLLSLLAVIDRTKPHEQPPSGNKPVGGSSSSLSPAKYSTSHKLNAQKAPNASVKAASGKNYTAENRPLGSGDIGSGDIDSMAAQLIMAEKSKQKPKTSKSTIYKWIAAIAIVSILVIVITG